MQNEHWIGDIADIAANDDRAHPPSRQVLRNIAAQGEAGASWLEPDPRGPQFGHSEGANPQGESGHILQQVKPRRRDGNLIGKAAFAQFGFATDSPLEEAGFELPVPRPIGVRALMHASRSRACRVARRRDSGEERAG